MSDEDRDLRELFAQLKREDRGMSPSFRMPARSVSPRGRPMTRVLVAAAVVVIAVVLAWPDRTPSDVAGPVVDLSASTWRSPTDFLLVTPGSELLRSVPSVGSPDDWTPIHLRGDIPAAESTRRTPS